LSTPITLDKDLYFLESDSNISIDGSLSSKALIVTGGSAISMKGMSIICGTDTDGRCIENQGDLILEEMNFFDGSAGSGSSIHNGPGATIEIHKEVEIK